MKNVMSLPNYLAREEQTYKRTTVNITDVPKKKTSVNIEEDTGNNGSSLLFRSMDQLESKRGNGQSHQRIHEKARR